LKADVLAASEQIERTERRRGIGRVEYERAHHAPGTFQIERIGLGPTGGRESGAQLGKRADEHNVHGVAGQSIAGQRVAWHVFTPENPQTQMDAARQDNVGRGSVAEGNRKHRRQPAVDQPEDIDDQPDGQDAERQHQEALQKTNEYSPHQGTLRQKSVRIAPPSLASFWKTDSRCGPRYSSRSLSDRPPRLAAYIDASAG
jgi:hypothetical protein